MADDAAVTIGGRLAGTITNLPNGRNVFLFAREYVSDERRPVLSLSLFDEERGLSLPELTPQPRLLPFFEGLLPEAQLRTHLASRAGFDRMSDFALLSLLGDDLPGAVRVRHRDHRAAEPAERDPDVLKFSLAGGRLKFSAIADGDGGLSIPAHGRGGDWIVKLPSHVFSALPENEFAMLAFAKMCGIEVSAFGLIETGSIRNLPPEIRTDRGRSLRIERFDRDGERRIHIEDFAQIFGQRQESKYRSGSYENLLKGIWQVLGERDAREFVRRLIFTIGIGNGDMHLQNWSVRYADGVTPHLAPAYGYQSTIAYSPADELALALAGTRRWADIGYDHLELFARRASVPRGVVLVCAREMVDRMTGAWPELIRNVEVGASTLAALEAHRRSIPIFRAG